ncbi:MAG: helix-turn-helix transcriptional regulator [Chloroflexota bacterium]|nr:helix-turn-helix transcriptional regulator [Chloroflexota bacterium]
MPASQPEEFRLQFRAIRERRGLTQVALGQRAGMAPASISHFETGQRVPSLESLVKLADALGVSVDELLGRVPADASVQVDPLFLRASRAPTETLDAVKRVTAALLGEDQTT